MEKKQTEKKDSLWNYISLDAYKPEFLKAIGLMDEKELDAFMKAYCSEIDSSDLSPDSQISISFNRLPKMLERWPRFKEQLNFLCLATVPLQMKMLEMGKGIDVEEDTDFSFENVLEQFASSKFKNDMYFRWQLYLSTILNTFASLKKELTSNKLLKTINFMSVFKKDRRQKADNLDTLLHQMPKGIGKYFLSNETVLSLLNNENKKVATAYNNISKLFYDSEQIMSKEEVLTKEGDILDLFENAVSWKTTDEKNEKIEKKDLSDWIFKWRKDLEKIKEDVKNDDVRDSVKNAAENAKLKEIFKEQELNRLYAKSRNYFYTDAELVYFKLFYKLGLVNQAGLTLMNDLLAEHLDKMSKKTKEDPFEAYEKFEELKDNTDYEEDDDDFDEYEDNDEYEEDDDEDEEEYSISLYEPKNQEILNKISKKVKDQRYSNDFDFNISIYVLRQINPLLQLKSVQLDDMRWDEADTAQEVEHEKNKFQKPLNQFNDLEKISLLNCIVSTTIQDLKKQKLPAGVRDANVMKDLLNDLLDGLPEYWFDFFMEQFNHYFSKTDNIAKIHSAKVLLEDLSYCFRSGRECGLGVPVKKEDIPCRLSKLKLLANQAVYMNPKWKKRQKDDIWGYIFDLNIASLPHLVSSKVPLKDYGQKVHE